MDNKNSKSCTFTLDMFKVKYPPREEEALGNIEQLLTYENKE